MGVMRTHDLLFIETGIIKTTGWTKLAVGPSTTSASASTASSSTAAATATAATSASEIASPARHDFLKNIYMCSIQDPYQKKSSAR